MSRKPRTSHLRTIRTSHWRAGVRALVAVLLIFAAWITTLNPGTPEASAEYWDWVGWLSMLAFVGVLMRWLPALFVPDRLIIKDDGFVIRTFWRGERFYPWEDIARVWNTSFLWAKSFVCWSDKVDGKKPRRPTYKRDGELPSAKIWTVSNDEIVKAMELAKGRYERRQKQGS